MDDRHPPTIIVQTTTTSMATNPSTSAATAIATSPAVPTDDNDNVHSFHDSIPWL
ncbi:hypothetical protein SCLCIDRAFT_1219515 [Scleroderma citrinum Foug A]|uniref:Uncharacterized protein n=1 Tax=Scleroderma citrinum Foug A TaxID=1036808 RepID=A0A0C3D9N7_9AGAM|nr:hypothetical protein SCLCIDRAFT_1219515 [Scleroderma citrinum Foug A]